ncbi:DUF5348 domain-containing protein [Paenibacillus sp. MBLB4367]|uniref:DUF5348 domain-containing protein n=1 Tax=Paenibacillus sp. MBLB4367 TaxID=3384767 RepID=UPI003907FEA3
MKHKWSKMTYDREGERWVVHLGGQTYGLHCGEWFEMRLGDMGVPCRMELDHDWYVVTRGARFILRKRDTYEVEM